MLGELQGRHDGNGHFKLLAGQEGLFSHAPALELSNVDFQLRAGRWGTGEDGRPGASDRTPQWGARPQRQGREAPLGLSCPGWRRGHNRTRSPTTLRARSGFGRGHPKIIGRRLPVRLDAHGRIIGGEGG